MQAPASRQGDRMLPEPERSEVRELEARLESADKADDGATVDEVGAKALAIRIRLQGADHWQVTDLRLLLEDVKFRRSLPPPRRAELAKAEESRRNLGSLLREGNLTKALEEAERVRALRAAILPADHIDLAGDLANEAVLLDQLGRHARADQLLSRALIMTENAVGPGHPRVAATLNNRGVNLLRTGRLDEAEAQLRQSLAIRDDALPAGHPATAVTLANLAEVIAEQGRFDEAELLHRRALELRERLATDELDIARSQLSLGAMLRRRGSIDLAEPLLEAAAGRLNGAGAPKTSDRAEALRQLGLLRMDRTNLTEAEERLTAALAIQREVRGERSLAVATILHDLGTARRRAGKSVEAAAAFDECLQAFESARGRLGARGLDRSQASANLRFASSIVHQRLDSLGSKRAFEILEAAVGMGLAEELADRERSRRQAGTLRIVDTRRELERRRRTLELLQSRAPAEADAEHRTRIQETRQSVLTLEKALAALDDSNAATPSAPVRPASLAEIQAALAPGEAIIRWFDFDATHRGIIVRKTGDPVFVSIPGEAADGKWSAKDEATLLGIARSLSEPPTAATRRALEDRCAGLRRRRWDPLTPALGAREGLPAVSRVFVLPSEAMLSIPIGLLAPPELTVAYLPSATTLVRLRSAPKSKPGVPAALLVGDPVFDAAPEGAERSPAPPRGMIVRGIRAERDPGWRKLRLDDVLLEVDGKPVSAAADLAARPGVARGPKGSSLSVWRQRAGRSDGHRFAMPLPEGPPPGLVIAPVPPPETWCRMLATRAASGPRAAFWAPLPGTKKEIGELERLLKETGHETLALVGSDASEQRLAELESAGTLPRFRFLHFATHGTADRSGAKLILSRDNLPDPVDQALLDRPVFLGELTADRVRRDWNLNADLVTLSACQSGLGRRIRGEGHVGFAQAFLVAGAKGVVLSLWQVDDEATTLLMGRFYRNLLGRREGLAAPLPADTALREAGVWLRNLEAEEAAGLLGVNEVRGKAGPEDQPFDHPVYWGAFILVGIDPGG